MSPRKLIRYNQCIHVAIEDDFKYRAQALALVKGFDKLSPLARMLMRKGMELELAALSPKEREDLEFAEANLRKAEEVKSQAILGTEYEEVLGEPREAEVGPSTPLSE